MARENEHAFIDKVPEEYNCSICTKVLDEPMLTDCCGQHFCKVCLENWFETGPGQKRTKTCPHCRSEEFVYIKSLPLKRKISSLEIYCPNHAKGCREQFSLGVLENHLATCSFVYVECTNKCGVVLLRKDLQEHCQKTCPNRKVKCQHCGMSGIHEQITGFHLTACPDVPLMCPRKCRKQGIKRKDLTVHKQECPLEPVQCPFYEAGCKEKLPRKDLEVHTSSSIQQHLQLVVITSTKNQVQLDLLKEEHDILKKDHVSLKSENHEFQQKFANLVSCVAKEADCIDPTRRGFSKTNKGLQCIKTAMLSSTSMLGPSPERYCLHLTWESDKSLRTPSVYLRPGYKVHLCFDKRQLQRVQPTTHYNAHYSDLISTMSYSLILEKSEKDDSLPWPIPNTMEIEIVAKQITVPYVHSLSQPQQQSLCDRCNPCVNLSRVGAGSLEHVILTWKLQVAQLVDRVHSPNGFYAYISLVDHSCP